jgi:hypothetical protein
VLGVVGAVAVGPAGGDGVVVAGDWAGTVSARTLTTPS